MNAPRVAPVAALIFDPGDVLYDATLWRRWLLQVLGRLGLHTHYCSFYRVFEREHLSQAFCGRRDFWDALRSYLLEVGLSRGQIDEVLVAGQARQRQLQCGARPLPGVAATLAQLAAREIRLACLCNSPWPSAEVVEELDTLGLAGHFELVISSCDLGCCMPASEAYRAALSQLRLPAEDVAFVGHDSQELAGAATAGLWTIGVNHDADAEADILLERFEQLLQGVCYRSAHVLAG
jgi:FMN phosphatase YigB (HAD superfamily)